MGDCNHLQPALFLDRDGVIIHDVNLLVHPDQVKLMDGAVEALRAVRKSGYITVVISNQPVVSRGLVSEKDVEEIHNRIQCLLTSEGEGGIDAYYFCPHHPNATLLKYRVDCQCRKPRPGLLLQAAQDLRIDLGASFMIGDRVSDVLAGQRAGCNTILVKTGMHLEPPIESPDPVEINQQPNYVCTSLCQAVDWILLKQR